MPQTSVHDSNVGEGMLDYSIRGPLTVSPLPYHLGFIVGVVRGGHLAMAHSKVRVSAIWGVLAIIPT
jgi:hypothetical protein